MENLLTVSSLNYYIKNIIENDSKLNNVIVRGEVSNLNKHYTGHYYFTLKDENSKISCMMFSSYVKYLKKDLANGDEVIIYGYISVYDKSGQYQLYCRKVEPYGLGQYLLQLEALKKKLKEEGLFDLPRKPIPLFPKKIALITSKTGAAVQDLIHTIQSRYNPEIYVFPCLVQGEDAPKSILKQFLIADSMDFDTIIIGRGGGANEDLKAYNDEELVRAVAKSKTPVISAVGHQIDTTLIDFVSSLKAITPTDAGEKATPDRKVLLSNIEGYMNYASSTINALIERKKKELLLLVSSKSFINPLDYLLESSKKVLNLQNKGQMIVQFKLNEYLTTLNQKKVKLTYLGAEFLSSYKNIIQNMDSRLKAINPYSIIDKGYSLVKGKDGKVLSSLHDYQIKQKVYIQLKDGLVEAEVISKKEN